MEIITCEDFELSESIRHTAHEKALEIRRFMKWDIPIQFFFKMEAKQFATIITANIRGETITSHSKNKDFVCSLNRAKSKLIRQFVDRKTKVMTRKRHPRLKEKSNGFDSKEAG